MSRQDVCYCLNAALIAQGSPFRCINTAVEATLLRQRSCGVLLPQDKFLRDNIEANDIVVVSVGGNDIALAPSPCTILQMLIGIGCTPTAAIHHAVGTPAPCDDCCCGCGPGCLSMLSSCPPSAGYFLHMFHTKVQAYVRSLTGESSKRRQAVCNNKHTETIYSSIYLSIYLSIHLSIYLSIYLSIHLSIYLTNFSRCQRRSNIYT